MTSLSPGLAARVRQGYLSGTEMDVPIEVMGRVYPEFFGRGLRREDARESTGDADLIDLGIGSYLPSDPAIAQAVIDGIRGGDTHYPKVPGVREAIASSYREDYGVTLDPDKELRLVAGARASMTLALLAALNPGDRVLVPDPDYVGLAHPAAGLGAEIVRVPLRRAADSSFGVDVDEVLAAIDGGCRIMMLTNPNNPTGYTWGAGDLATVAAAIARVGGLMIVNEVYDRLVFDGHRHTCALSVGHRDHVVVVGGTGKVFNMTGLPLGWVAGPEWLVRALDDVMFLFHVPGPSGPALHAGIAALSQPLRERHPAEVREVLQANGRATAAVFNSFESMRCPPAHAGQFVFPWVGGDDISLAVDLRREAQVTVMPGSAWGLQGRGHLRVAVANDPDLQRRGLARLTEGLNALGYSPASNSAHAASTQAHHEKGEGR